MKVIYKYRVEVDEPVILPGDAEILHINSQNNAIQLWALVDPSSPDELRKIYIFGTGQPLPDSGGLEYINTFLMDGGEYVFHAFEETS